MPTPQRACPAGASFPSLSQARGHGDDARRPPRFSCKPMLLLSKQHLELSFMQSLAGPSAGKSPVGHPQSSPEKRLRGTDLQNLANEQSSGVRAADVLTRLPGQNGRGLWAVSRPGTVLGRAVIGRLLSHSICRRCVFQKPTNAAANCKRNGPPTCQPCANKPPGHGTWAALQTRRETHAPAVARLTLPVSASSPLRRASTPSRCDMVRFLFQPWRLIVGCKKRLSRRRSNVSAAAARSRLSAT